MPTITVTNAAQLSAALNTARSGDVILLAPGNYGELWLSNKTFDGTVTIASLDPAREAAFTKITLNGVSNLHFKSVEAGYALAPGEPDYAQMVTLRSSTNISFDDVSFRGSMDGNPANDGNGLSVLNSNNIRVVNSEFQQLGRGALFGSTTNIEVSNNKFHDLRSDGADFSNVQNVLIAGNHFTDFYPNDGDHPDAIQFWTRGTTTSSTDIVIRDNVILQGQGRGLQGIFVADTEGLPYQRVTISNNLVYVTEGYNGLFLNNGRDAVIQNNTVVSPRGDQYNLYIRLEEISNLVLKDNVSDTIINNRNPDAIFINNLRLDQSPGRVSDIRDINARSLASPLGLEVDGIGYRSGGGVVPVEFPRIGTKDADAIYLGKNMNSNVVVDGLGDRDSVSIQGDYSHGVTLGVHSLMNVESLVVMSGLDPRRGDTAGNLYSYKLTSVDANVAAGETFRVSSNNLKAGENLIFDGSAETDGNFNFALGLGIDTVKGGAGDDRFYFQDGAFRATDRIDGGAGHDTVAFRGDFSGGIVFTADTIRNIESLVLSAGSDTRYGAFSTGFGYNITTHDANVAAGQRLRVSGVALGVGEEMVFDGSAERDGSFQLVGGAANDRLTGGAGDDFLCGAFGADRLDGGGGSDTFLLRSAEDSTGLNFDQIVGFDCREDKIDLPKDVAGFSDVIGAGRLSAATFDLDLAAALDAFLGGKDAVLFTASTGDFAGRTFAVIDGNGRAGYQAGEDYVIELVNPVVPIVPGVDVFI